MQVKEISLADVLANEENPRENFGDVAALAATFEHGLYPGEPINPIIVVADGTKYRIVDGERRYRAMSEIGTERCHALVCDDLDDANAAVAMIATDDKLQLSDLEKSRGTQQMLLLGVDPSTVDKVAHVEGSDRALRALRSLGPKFGRASQLTFDQLVTLDEFDGDAVAVERLLDAKPKDFSSEAALIRNERKVERDRAVIAETLKRLRVEIREKADTGMASLAAGSADNIEASVAEACAVATGVYAVVSPGEATRWYVSKPIAYLYGEPFDTGEPDDGGEADERRERVRLLASAMPGASGAPSRWFADRVRNDLVTRSMREWLFDEFEDQHCHQLDAFFDATGFSVGQGARDAADSMGELDFVVAWQKALPDASEWLASTIVDGRYSRWSADSVKGVLDFLVCVQEFGYEMTDAEHELAEACEGYLALGEDEG